jgi:hypothetical protein
MTGRIVAAFAVVPLVVFVVARMGWPLVWTMSGNSGQIISPDDPATTFAALTAFVGLLVTLFGAVPAFVWMKRRGPVSLSRAIGAGVVLGNSPMVASAIGAASFTILHIIGGTISQHLSPPLDVIAGFLRLSIIGSVLGVISAFVFWQLGVRGTDIDPSDRHRLTASR